MHEPPIWWGLGTIDVHNLTPASKLERLFPKFEPVTNRSQYNNLINVPKLVYYTNN